MSLATVTQDGQNAGNDAEGTPHKPVPFLFAGNGFGMRE
jgi:hypothetical protein